MKKVHLLPRSAGAPLIVIHGCAMLALGLALLYVRSTRTNVFFNVFGGAVAILLESASLFFVAIVDWTLAAGLGRHQLRNLRGLLAMTTAVAICSFLLIAYPGSRVELFCDLIALYAFAFSLAKGAIARCWNGGRKERFTMYTLAGIALAFSVGLVKAATQDDRTCLAVVAGYCIFMGLQMMLTLYFVQKHKDKRQLDTSSRPLSAW